MTCFRNSLLVVSATLITFIGQFGRMSSQPFNLIESSTMDVALERLVVPFAKRSHAVVGVDVSPSMLVQARENCKKSGADLRACCISTC